MYVLVDLQRSGRNAQQVSIEFAFLLSKIVIIPTYKVGDATVVCHIDNGTADDVKVLRDHGYEVEETTKPKDA